VLVFPISAAKLQRMPSAGGRATVDQETHPSERGDVL
jgi:hypothetical protein